MRARFRCRLAVVVERKAVNTIESRRPVKQAYCRRSRRWIALLWRLLEQLPKLDVAGSTPVARSREFEQLAPLTLRAARRRGQFGGTWIASLARVSAAACRAGEEGYAASA